MMSAGNEIRLSNSWEQYHLRARNLKSSANRYHRISAARAMVMVAVSIEFCVTEMAMNVFQMGANLHGPPLAIDCSMMIRRIADNYIALFKTPEIFATGVNSDMFNFMRSQ